MRSAISICSVLRSRARSSSFLRPAHRKGKRNKGGKVRSSPGSFRGERVPAPRYSPRVAAQGRERKRERFCCKSSSRRCAVVHLGRGQGEEKRKARNRGSTVSLVSTVPRLARPPTTTREGRSFLLALFTSLPPPEKISFLFPRYSFPSFHVFLSRLERERENFLHRSPPHFYAHYSSFSGNSTTMTKKEREKRGKKKKNLLLLLHYSCLPQSLYLDFLVGKGEKKKGNFVLLRQEAG